MKVFNVLIMVLFFGCGKTVLKIPADQYDHIKLLQKECSDDLNDITEVYANLIEHYNFKPSGYGWKYQLVVECEVNGVDKLVKDVIKFGNSDDYKTRWW